MSFISQKDVSSNDPRTITILLSPSAGDGLFNNGIDQEVPLFGRFRVIIKRVYFHLADGSFSPEYSNTNRVPIAISSNVLRPPHYMTKAVPSSIYRADQIHIMSFAWAGKNLEYDLGVLDIYGRIDLGFYVASNGSVIGNWSMAGVVLAVYGQNYKPYIPKTIPIFRQFYLTTGAGIQRLDPRLIGRFHAKMIGWLPRPTGDIGAYTRRFITIDSPNIHIDPRGSTDKLTLNNFNEINGFMMAPMKMGMELDIGVFQYSYYDELQQNTNGDPFILWFHFYDEKDRLDFLRE